MDKLEAERKELVKKRDLITKIKDGEIAEVKANVIGKEELAEFKRDIDQWEKMSLAMDRKKASLMEPEE